MLILFGTLLSPVGSPIKSLLVLKLPLVLFIYFTLLILSDFILKKVFPKSLQAYSLWREMLSFANMMLFIVVLVWFFEGWSDYKEFLTEKFSYTATMEEVTQKLLVIVLEILIKLLKSGVILVIFVSIPILAFVEILIEKVLWKKYVRVFMIYFVFLLGTFTFGACLAYLCGVLYPILCGNVLTTLNVDVFTINDITFIKNSLDNPIILISGNKTYFVREKASCYIRDGLESRVVVYIPKYDLVSIEFKSVKIPFNLTDYYCEKNL